MKKTQVQAAKVQQKGWEAVDAQIEARVSDGWRALDVGFFVAFNYNIALVKTMIKAKIAAAAQDV